MSTRADSFAKFCFHFCRREFGNREKCDKHSRICPKSCNRRSKIPMLSSSLRRGRTQKGINPEIQVVTLEEALCFQDFRPSRAFQEEYRKKKKYYEKLVEKELRSLEKDISPSLPHQRQPKKKKKRKGKKSRSRSKSLSSLSSRLNIPTSSFFSEEPKSGVMRKRMKKYVATPRGRKRSFTGSRFNDILPRVQSYHQEDSLKKFRLFEIEKMKKKKEKYLDSMKKSRFREEKYKKWKTITHSKVEAEIERTNELVERKKKELERKKEEKRAKERQEEMLRQTLERERTRKREKIYLRDEVRRMTGRIIFQEVYDIIGVKEEEKLQKRRMMEEMLKNKGLVDQKRRTLEYGRLKKEIMSRRKVVENVHRSLELKIMKKLTRDKKREGLERSRIVGEIGRRKKQERRIERKWIEIKRKRMENHRKVEEEREKKRIMERVYRTEVSKHVTDWFSSWEKRVSIREEEKKGRLLMENTKREEESEIRKIRAEYESERKRIFGRMIKMERKKKAQDLVLKGVREQMKGILGRVIEFQKSSSEARTKLLESELRTIEYEMEKAALLARIEDLEQRSGIENLVFKCKIRRKDCFDQDDRFILLERFDSDNKKNRMFAGGNDECDPEEILEMYLCTSKKDEEFEET